VLRISLEDFLRTGRFGPVEVGMHELDVQKWLGVTEMKGGESRKHRHPALWCYGSIEFHFDPETRCLWLIFTDHFATPLTGGDTFELDAWILSGNLTRAEAEEHLRAAGIPYQLRPYAGDKDAQEIVTAGEVSLIFRERLDAISRQR
jgi:hypothetical protein